jgi:hypothetical protein
MMPYARQAAHFFLSSVGLAVWGVAMCFMVLAVALSHLCHKVCRNPDRQNCWSHTLWRWNTYGGYLAVRKADGVQFIKWLPVPHVLWLMEIPKKGVRLEQYVPIKRERAKWLPWFTGYFKGRVIHFDSNHAADMERYRSEMRSVEDSQQQ